MSRYGCGQLRANPACVERKLLVVKSLSDLQIGTDGSCGPSHQIEGGAALCETTDLPEFARGFIACGYMFRTEEPSKSLAFSYFLDCANAFLSERWGIESVSGSAFLAGIIAHNDVARREANPALGQVLEVGLDPHSGRPCSSTNAWRSLVDGSRPLKPALPPAERLRRAQAAPPVRIFQKTPDGQLRRVGDDESLWR